MNIQNLEENSSLIKMILMLLKLFSIQNVFFKPTFDAHDFPQQYRKILSGNRSMLSLEDLKQYLETPLHEYLYNGNEAHSLLL